MTNQLLNVVFIYAKESYKSELSQDIKSYFEEIIEDYIFSRYGISVTAVISDINMLLDGQPEDKESYLVFKTLKNSDVILAPALHVENGKTLECPLWETIKKEEWCGDRAVFLYNTEEWVYTKAEDRIYVKKD